MACVLLIYVQLATSIHVALESVEWLLFGNFHYFNINFLLLQKCSRFSKVSLILDARIANVGNFKSSYRVYSRYLD